MITLCLSCHLPQIDAADLKERQAAHALDTNRLVPSFNSTSTSNMHSRPPLSASFIDTLDKGSPLEAYNTVTLAWEIVFVASMSDYKTEVEVTWGDGKSTAQVIVLSRSELLWCSSFLPVHLPIHSPRAAFHDNAAVS